MKAQRPPGLLKRRLASILGQHLLLFCGLGIADRQELGGQYGALLRFGRRPSPGQRRELVSVLLQHRLMFGEGVIDSDPAAYRECSALIRQLSVEPGAPSPPARGLNWDMLGLGILRRRIAFPLYGRARPAEPPGESGALLELTNLEAGRYRLSYTDAGIRLAGTFEVFFLHIDPRFDAGRKAGGARLVFRGEAGALSVGPGQGSILAPDREISPLGWRYAFFFPRQPGAQARVVRFLEREISTRLELDFREAETAAVEVLRALAGQYGFRIRE